MFMEEDSNGKPITAQYARTRMKWEPAVEMTQIKGDSETHPLLSPNDEFADFETYEHLIKASGDKGHGPTITEGDYLRSALRRGLEIDQKVGANPYKVGMIGASDSHSGYSTVEENNFWGKFSIDSTPETKSFEPIPGATGWDMSSSGLAGVWAKENTRKSITAAFKRKEVYGTSGPRIKVRTFGGWDFDSNDSDAKDIARIGYEKGVPMGGDLTKAPKGKAPSFLIHAVKDPVDANLDRIQVIKGWVDAKGKSHEKIFNVVWSGKRKLKSNGKLPKVGNTVDLKTGRYTNTIGSSQLATVWTDPEFNPNQRSFYYVRVLQIPTARHTLLDAIALQKPHPKKYKKTIQERAYTTPVWYTP